MRLFLSEGRFYIPAYFGNSAPAVWPTPQNSPGSAVGVREIFGHARLATPVSATMDLRLRLPELPAQI